MKDIDIAKLARRSGVFASTLRFYEEKGLIRSIRRSGLQRVFGPDALREMTLIALSRVGGPAIERSLVARKVEELSGTIRRLRAMRKELRHVAACPAENHLECPKFARMRGIAGMGLFGGEPAFMPAGPQTSVTARALSGAIAGARGERAAI